MIMDDDLDTEGVLTRVISSVGRGECDRFLVRIPVIRYQVHVNTIDPCE